MPNPIIKKPAAKWSDKERKFELLPRAQFETSLLPVIQNLLAQGLTAKDIGMMVGYQGKNAEDWLANLRQYHDDVKLATQTGYEMANSRLVAQMFREAIGYDYEEEDIEYKTIQDPNDPTQLKEIPIKKTVKKKHKIGNPQLLMFMAENHLPEDYKRRTELVKKNINLDLKAEPTAEQIDRLFGKLCESKVIDAEVIETEVDETQS